MILEIRKSGGNHFYLVEIDENDNSKEVYSDGKLVIFDSVEEGEEYIEDSNNTMNRSSKKKWRVK